MSDIFKFPRSGRRGTGVRESQSPPYGPTKREQIRVLKEENRRLRLLVGLEEPTTLESWGEHAPQELRDKMAASALIAEHLNEVNALRRLGFGIMAKEGEPRTQMGLRPVVKAWCKEIFGTPGVQAILSRNYDSLLKNNEAMVERLAQTALHGDDTNSTKAFQELAKTLGWHKESAALPANVTNIFAMMGSGKAHRDARASDEPQETIDAVDFLIHEPGEATAVIDEERRALPR